MEDTAKKIVTAAAITAGTLTVANKLDEQFFFKKDMNVIQGLGSFALTMKKREIFGWTIADGIETACDTFGNKKAIVFNHQEQYTFKNWDQKANQIARWAQKVGIKKGEVVALVMENRPEFMFFWSGLSKIGAVGALINYNLRGDALLHCISVANCTKVVFGYECSDQINSAVDKMKELGYQLYCQHGFADQDKNDVLVPGSIRVDQEWNNEDISRLPKNLRDGVKYTDAALYIYTSGTTGLPKAAIVRHAKLDGAGTTFPLQFGIKSSDVIYNSGLPLYHSAATNIGIGVVLKIGATLVIRKKFSASKFWSEVNEFNCTVIQYIGELCRYLLATPPSPVDKTHR